MQVLDNIESNGPPPKNFDVLLGIALCSLFLGASLGVLAAWFNAWLSPEYFQETMGWNPEEARPASLIQGGLGGLAYGFAFAGFFAVVCGWATQFRCTFSFAFRQLAKIVLFVLFGWAFGGLAAGLLYQPPESPAALSAISFLPSALSSADWHGRWVAGAILGQKAGFLLGAAFCPLIVWRAWKGRKE